jgi:hypothetical protein
VMGWTRIRLEWRIAFGPATWLPALLLPLYALFRSLLWRAGWRLLELADLVQSFAVILPLAAGLMGAAVWVPEREVGFEPLRRTYPEPWWRSRLLRLCGVLLLLGWSLSVATAVYRVAYGPLPPWRAVVLPAVLPTLLLLGLAVLLAGLLGSYWPAAGMVVLCWAVAFIRRG